MQSMPYNEKKVEIKIIEETFVDSFKKDQNWRNFSRLMNLVASVEVHLMNILYVQNAEQ